MRISKLFPAAIVVLGWVGSTAAQEFVPLSNPDQRRVLYGFSILPPTGDGWLVLAPKEGHGLGFFRDLGRKASKKRHTALADVLYRWLQGCTDASSCLERGMERIRRAGTTGEGPEGIRTLSFEVIGKDEARPSCVWYEAIQEDTRVPGGRGKTFHAPAAGMACTHPDEPTLFLNALYSERFKKGQQAVHSMEGEARKFLESFRFEPLGTRVAGWVKLGPAAAGIALGPDRLWVQHRAEISEIDIATGNPIQTFSSGADGIALAYTEQSLWVGHLERNVLTRIDPDEGRVIATIPLPGPALGIAESGGILWARTGGKNPSVLRVDPALDDVTRIEGLEGEGAVTVCHDTVWATGGEGILYRIDPNIPAIMSQRYVCPGLFGVTCAEGKIWGACMGTGEVVGLDPETVQEMGRVRVLGSPMFLDGGDAGSLWVAHRHHGTVSRVALDTQEVSTPIPIGAGPFAIKAAFGRIWVTDRPEGKLYWIHPKEDGTGSRLMAKPASEEPSAAKADVLSSSEAAMPAMLAMGDESAPLILELFTDFASSYCARFHEETFPRIREEYIDTGKLQFRYRAFPLELSGTNHLPKAKALSREAFRAAEAARCAAEQGMEKFWSFFDTLMAHQRALNLADYETWAAESGLDPGAITECLAAGRAAPAVWQDIRDAKAAGLRSVPTFFLNGQRLSGAKPYKVFQKAFEEALEATAEPGP